MKRILHLVPIQISFFKSSYNWFKHNMYMLVTCTTTISPNKLLRSVLLLAQ